MQIAPIARWIMSIALAVVALAATGLAVRPSWSAMARTRTAAIPCTDPIQACIDSASDGDTIVIAAGTHNESLTLNKPVSLTSASGSAHTIIYATAGQRVLTVTGSSISQSVVISGLTFTGGDVYTTSYSTQGLGGGILITGAARPLFQNVVISNNRAHVGGGLFASEGSPLTLTSVLFISNAAIAGGGGAYLSDAAAFSSGRFDRNTCADRSCVGGGLLAANGLAASGTTFIANAASYGGGGAAVSGAATLTNGRFESNLCRHLGCWGGGLRLSGALRMSGTDFIGNQASDAGCGAYAYSATLTGGRFEGNRCTHGLGLGGGLFALTLTLSGTEFVGNAAGGARGGGGGAYARDALVSNGHFEDNQGGRGGGLWTSGALSLSNTAFIRNTAVVSGSGVLHTGGNARIVNALFADNAALWSGAALYVDSGDIIILHTTVAGAGLSPGTAISVTGGTVGITNTIIASHAVGIGRSGGTVYADYNLFFGTTISKTSAIGGGAHDRSGNPAFREPVSDDYHILFFSAAVDAGVDTGVPSDADGDSRPVGGKFDIGYDEWVGTIHCAYLPIVLKGR